MRTVILLCIIISSCVACKKVPDSNELSSHFTVITNRDPDAVFNEYKNFTISDTIAFVSNVPHYDTIITGDAAQVLVNTVKNNLKSNGYIQTDRFSNPDLGVKLSIIQQVDAGILYPWGWWWSLPGYPGGCYWGWCYPPSFNDGIVYAYHTGDLIVEVFDLKNAGENKFLHDVWTANAVGLLTSTTQENIDKAIAAINQAFAQSPYFKTN